MGVLLLLATDHPVGVLQTCGYILCLLAVVSYALYEILYKKFLYLTKTRASEDNYRGRVSIIINQSIVSFML